MTIDWTKEYDGAAEPDSGGNYDWTLTGTDYASCAAGIMTYDNIDSAIQGYYSQAPNVDFDSGFTLETRLKIIQTQGDYRAFILIKDGTQNEQIFFAIFDNKITVQSTDYVMDTTNAFHIYRITVSGTSIKVYVDGILRIEETVGDVVGDDTVAFGDNSGAGTNVEFQLDYLNYKLGEAITPPHPSLGFFIIA